MQGPKTLGVQNKYPMYCAVQIERVQSESTRTYGIKDTQILRNLCLIMSANIARI